MTQGWVSTTVGAFHLEVSWAVQPSEVLVLYGPSGSGKTLTLRTIAGLLRPQQGRIEVASNVVFDSAQGIHVPLHRRGIGYIPQHYGLFPHLTVGENIAYGLRTQSRAAARERVREALEAFHLTGLADRLPGRISGGQQQRAAIARAIASRPRLLLLDEPFSALDEDLRRSARQEVAALLEAWRIPVILVTHDRVDALILGRRVQVLENGRAAVEGSPADVLSRLPSAVAEGAENVFVARVEQRLLQTGLVRCRLGDVLLTASLAGVEEGREVRLAVRARDIFLATRKPEGLLGVNVLPGRIRAVRHRADGQEVEVDCAGLAVHVWAPTDTTASSEMETSSEIWAIVPQAALVVLDETDLAHS